VEDGWVVSVGECGVSVGKPVDVTGLSVAVGVVGGTAGEDVGTVVGGASDVNP
jgi:hypothetical protein